MNKPVQYKTSAGEWKDLVIMDEIIYNISKAVEMVRVSERTNIFLRQIVGGEVWEWDSTKQIGIKN